MVRNHPFRLPDQYWRQNQVHGLLALVFRQQVASLVSLTKQVCGDRYINGVVIGKASWMLKVSTQWNYLLESKNIQ